MTSVSSIPTRAKVFEATVTVFGGTNPQFYKRYTDPYFTNHAPEIKAGLLGTFSADVVRGENATPKTVSAIWNASESSTDLGFVSIVLEGDMILGTYNTEKILTDSGIKY